MTTRAALTAWTSAAAVAGVLAGPLATVATSQAPAAPAVSTPALPLRPDLAGPADVAAPRTDTNSQLAHEQLLAKRTQGRIDAYFLGDSITRRWGATDYPVFLAHWRATFTGWNAANYGWGGDGTQNILWRLEHGELDEVNPKVIVLLAGTNNIGSGPPRADAVDQVVRGVRAIVALCQRKAPRATIILTAIFPRDDKPALAPAIRAINAGLGRIADGSHVRWLDLTDRLADGDGRVRPGLMVDGLHLTVAGYQVWADGLAPLFNELLGARASTDSAPPPTGDPSAPAPRDPPRR